MRGLFGVCVSLSLIACSSASSLHGDGGGGDDLASGGGGGDMAGGGASTPLSMLPDTSARIVPFADQLGNGYSDALVRFVATHFAGTQKMLKAENDRFR